MALDDKCVICGTVRNCGPWIERALENMHTIGKAFAEYKIVLFYDESKDRTLAKLQAAQQRHPDIITLLINKDHMHELRTFRIAKGRNACMSVIRKEFANYSYFVVMDCDDRAAYAINTPLLHRCLARPDWDSISFRHPVHYYDSWALSMRPFVYNCYGFRDHSKGVRYMKQAMARTPRSKLIRVISAFNGIAIYRTPKFLNCTYDGAFNRALFPEFMYRENLRAQGPFLQLTKADCEHKSFHVQAVRRNGARIRVSPEQMFL